MKVDIYSCEEIERLIAEFRFPEGAAVIGFVDSIDEAGVDYSSVCADCFKIPFEDLEIDELTENGYTYEACIPEADELAVYIYKAYNCGRNIICQCEYGQGRSAGCAAAILEHFYHSGISVFSDYRYYPNKVVYHKVLDALNRYRGRT